MSSDLSLAKMARIDVCRYLGNNLSLEALLTEPLKNPELTGDEMADLDKILSMVRRVETAAQSLRRMNDLSVKVAATNVKQCLPRLQELYAMISGETPETQPAAFAQEFADTACTHALDAITRRIPDCGY